MKTWWLRLFLGFFLSFFSFLAVWHAELPQPGIELVPPALEAGSLNHWTTREVLLGFLLRPISTPEDLRPVHAGDTS